MESYSESNFINDLKLYIIFEHDVRNIFSLPLRLIEVR